MIVGSLLLILVAVILLGLGLARGSDPMLVGSITASLLAAITLIVGARRPALLYGLPDSRTGHRDERIDPDEVNGPDGSDVERSSRAGVTYGPGLPPAHLPSPERPAPADVESGPVPTARRAGVAEDDPVPAGVTVPPGGTGPVATGHPAAAIAATTTVPGPDPLEPMSPPGATRTATGTIEDHPGHGAPQPPGESMEGPPAGAGMPEGDWDEDEDPPDEPPPMHVSDADRAEVRRLTDDVLVMDGRPRYHLAGCTHLRDRSSEPLPVNEAIDLGFTPCSRCEPDRHLLARSHGG